MLIVTLTSCAHEEVAFTVDGVGVETNELVYYMQNNLSVIIAELEEQYDIIYQDERFWIEPQNGIDTFAQLRKYTERQIVRDKLVQIHAADYGEKTKVYFSDQQKELEKTNKERIRADAAGEVLYGPVTQEFRTYYIEMMTKAEKALLEGWKKDGIISVTSNEVLSYYEENEHSIDVGDMSKDDILSRIQVFLYEEAFEAKLAQMATESVIVDNQVVITPAMVGITE